jgi:hypothetical protein
MAQRVTELSADERFTVSGSGLRGLLAYARARGIPTEGVLEEAGLSAEAIQGPESRVSQAANNRVWERIVAASGDEDFGLHFARRMELDAFHVVGLLASKSPTVGEALERVVAYSRILHDGGKVEVELQGSAFHLFPGCRGLPHPWPRHVAEFSVGSVMMLLRRITGQPCTPREVHFRHARPARIREHVELLELPRGVCARGAGPAPPGGEPGGSGTGCHRTGDRSRHGPGARGG